MIIVELEAPFATFRKSFARSYGETYAFVPPSTVYGMLLSLVGETSRERHKAVKLAFGYRKLPRVITNVKKQSRFKYGGKGLQEERGNTLDYVQTLCGISMICWIDSGEEWPEEETLEKRVKSALCDPHFGTRFGVLSLGLSDDAVDTIRLLDAVREPDLIYRLVPSELGSCDLPTWVDHLGSAGTRLVRYTLTAQDTKCGSMELIDEP